MNGKRLTLTFSASAILIYFGLINVFVLAILTLTGTPMKIKLIVCGLFDLYYLLSIVRKKIPIKILVDQSLGLLVVETLWYFVLKKEIRYNISGLTCTYKEEMHVKGIFVRVLRIREIENGNCLLEIIPGYSGWSKRKLKLIFESLQPRISS